MLTSLQSIPRSHFLHNHVVQTSKFVFLAYALSSTDARLQHECGLRMSIFFSAATAAGAFGGLLARAITEMDHTAGLRAWQWIFILEGIATFLVGKCGTSC